MLRKIKQSIETGGVPRAIRRSIPYTYREYVRPRLPKSSQTVILNGVPASSGGFCTFDRFIPDFRGVPDQSENDPEYEAALLSALHQQATSGDLVVIIGGGWGVSATVAANIVGDSGSVTVYEGSQDRVRDIKRTLELNEVSETVSVRHGIVGEPVSILGDSGAATRFDPAELSECDVLEMDCEGSETDIIPRLEIAPPTLIVETHRNEETVIEQLEDKGYSVTGRGVEKPGEIFVLTAER